jgi:hypothetical protein
VIADIACDKRTCLVVDFRLGTSKGIQECQEQFQDRHWNCSIVRDGTVFGSVLDYGEMHGDERRTHDRT